MSLQVANQGCVRAGIRTLSAPNVATEARRLRRSRHQRIGLRTREDGAGCPHRRGKHQNQHPSGECWHQEATTWSFEMQTRGDACDDECPYGNAAQDDQGRNQPLPPRGILAENVDLLSHGSHQRDGQEPPSPPTAPVVLPHRHHTDAKQRRNGWSHHRKVILMEEARDAKEDAHGEQPHAPQQQRLLLAVALQAWSSLPGQGDGSQEREGQEPGNLPCQWLSEETQRTRGPDIKEPTSTSTTARSS